MGFTIIPSLELTALMFKNGLSKERNVGMNGRHQQHRRGSVMNAMRIFIHLKCVMETKTNKAISLLQCGDFKAALTIFSTFRIGFTKEEQRTLKIASESLSGNSSFYRQLGIDTDKAIEKSKSIITSKYLKMK